MSKPLHIARQSWNSPNNWDLRHLLSPASAAAAESALISGNLCHPRQAEEDSADFPAIADETRREARRTTDARDDDIITG